MPRTTIGGDDPKHKLSEKLKDLEEKRLRDLAKIELLGGNPKMRKKLDNQARNISRDESKRADHHK